MADALGGAGAHSAGDVPALGAAGGAGHIVFGGVGEDAEFLEPVHKTDLLCVRKFEQMFVRYGHYSIRTSVCPGARAFAAAKAAAQNPLEIRQVSVKQLNPTYGYDHRSDFLRCVSVIERLPCAKGAVSEAD